MRLSDTFLRIHIYIFFWMRVHNYVTGRFDKYIFILLRLNKNILMSYDVDNKP